MQKIEHETRRIERRTALGKFKPFLYMVLEIVALLMLCWLVTKFDILYLSTVLYIGTMFYIVTSVIPRYQKAMRRQEYPTYSETKSSFIKS